MKRFFVVFAAVAALLFGQTGSIIAQESDPRFSNEILSTLGYPAMVIEAEADGFSVPSEIATGPTNVILTSLPETFTYVAFMQPAEGLSPEEATDLALLSAREDVAHDGWVYGGGSYAENGGEVSFVVNLQPGDWQIAASYQHGPEGEEIMNRYPLIVTSSEETAAEPAAGVTIELNDTEFILPEGTVATGPQVFHITNIGDAARQLVLVKSPRELTVTDFEQWFASASTGTPGPEAMNQTIWVGYAAILSPGQSVWIELDLEPGVYTTTSWVVDPEAGMPALLLGMVGNFTVA
ncbi:MAG: hypothetical protein KF883_14450 [Thermomicrobiales bacterium]|nr:hypothetical protein [Thermomicrobiales bacterium]